MFLHNLAVSCVRSLGFAFYVQFGDAKVGWKNSYRKRIALFMNWCAGKRVNSCLAFHLCYEHWTHNQTNGDESWAMKMTFQLQQKFISCLKASKDISFCLIRPLNYLSILWIEQRQWNRFWIFKIRNFISKNFIYIYFFKSKCLSQDFL